LIDLYTLVEVVEINLYSRHKDNRTTQRYSVYGSKTKTVTNVTNFDLDNTEIWTFVGSVHSGHYQGDGGFDGVIGSSIAVPSEIGQLRYLLLVIEDAPSSNGDSTFVAEIDVIIE